MGPAERATGGEVEHTVKLLTRNKHTISVFLLHFPREAVNKTSIQLNEGLIWETDQMQPGQVPWNDDHEISAYLTAKLQHAFMC